MTCKTNCKCHNSDKCLKLNFTELKLIEFYLDHLRKDALSKQDMLPSKVIEVIDKIKEIIGEAKNEH